MSAFDNDYDDDEVYTGGHDDQDFGDADEDYDDEEADKAADGASDDEAMIAKLIPMLIAKFKLSIPAEDTNPKSFLRDLYMACCGHPGWEESGAAEESGEDHLSEDDEFDTEGSDPNFGVGSTQLMPPGRESRQKMSRRRKQKQLSQKKRANRGLAAAVEQLANSRIEPKRGLLAKAGPKRLSHPGPTPRRRPGTKREREVLSEVLGNAKLA
jgi:hypothetical protein